MKVVILEVSSIVAVVHLQAACVRKRELSSVKTVLLVVQLSGII